MATSSETRSEVKAPSELERARANYWRRAEKDFDIVTKDNKEAMQFISAVSRERMDKLLVGMSEEDQTEFLENLPSSLDLEVREGADQQGYKNVEVQIYKLKNVKPELRRQVMQELLKQCWLLKKFDREFKRGYNLGEHDLLALVAWLDGYEAFIARQKKLGHDEDTIISKGKLRLPLFDRTSSEEAVKACENDPALFVDGVFAMAATGQYGIGSKESITEKIIGTKGFNAAGNEIMVTDDGLPYRKGKRKEDTALAAERLKLYRATSETPVMTYQELVSERSDLVRQKEMAEKSSAELAVEKEKARTEAEELKVRTKIGGAWAGEMAKDMQDLGKREKELRRVVEQIANIVSETDGFGKRGKGFAEIKDLLEQMGLAKK